MKRLPMASLGAALLVLFVGCATVGEIPVDIAGNEPIYISPANNDGIQDQVTYPLSVTPLERTVLKGYSVVVSDLSGGTVRSAEQSVPSGGLFRSTRKAAVTPPEFLLWDGRNDAGELVADGEYQMVVTVQDNKGNTGVSPAQRIIVDNTPPSCEVSLAFELFTPNDDGILDTLTVYQRRASSEDRWQGSFLASGGTAIRTYDWTGAPADVRWDGKNNAGSVASEGAYEYRLASTDRAGNSTLYAVSGITLERNPRSVRLQTDRVVFSPNGDGRMDTLTFLPTVTTTQNLSSWRIDVRDIRGDVVRTFTGTTVPRSLVFDGRDNAGELLDDGQYRAVFEVIYDGGQRPTTASPEIALDTTPPRATVAVSNVVFSPDGDGRRDTVEVLQSGSIETAWVGSLSDSAGATIRTQTWSGRLTSFVWDGKDTGGKPLPDGTYTYRLSATDAGGNSGLSRTVRVVLDTRPTPIGIQAELQRFSPNGDGVQDTVPFALSATIADGIDQWTVSLLSGAGARLGIVTAGEGRLPDEVEWDGRLKGTRLADGDYTMELAVIYDKGNESSGLSRSVRLDTAPPQVTVRATPALFSPDGDGTDDQLSITLNLRDQSPIQRWDAVIYDPQGTEFMRWSGAGIPSSAIRWDGRSPTGELVQSAEDYALVVIATDAVWNQGTAQTVVPIDILVIRDGDRLRIQIASIYFVPYTADYINLEPEQAEKNLQTLDRLAEILTKYPQHKISVEGHAVSVLWYDQARAAREQQEVLLPLSLARANAIRSALVQRGIQSSRMSTAGYGGLYPVVPHSDEVNRWKSRRVEFILERR